MTELIAGLPFQKIGWGVAQFMWISAIYLGGFAFVLKILENFSSRLKYNLRLGALLTLPIIAGLLFVEHRNFLPPIGLADWGLSETGQVGREPILQGMPQFTGIELGNIEPSLYYWLGILWVIAVTFLIGYYLLTLMLVQRQCRKKPELYDPNIRNQLQKLANTLGISMRLKIRATGYQDGPAVSGIIQPCILIPKSLSADYSNEEIYGLLLHELTHIKRKDYLLSFLQRIVSSIFFFQPLVWWFSRKADRERELVCDQSVASITGNSYTYGSTLAKLQLQTQSVLSHTLNIAEKSVIERIKKLAASERNSLNFAQKCRRFCLAFLIIATTSFTTLWNSYHLHHTHNLHLQSEEEKQERSYE